ncbi:hypothetical protein CMI37_05810 [Candidatus Pacearchaeota archaeon]|nr:hypothetical protein [Candidatus Pacearchaeota archaeon]|tara:strand:+ start:4986 stop:5237 length:252 start_codon:yes stop_codon:yes gene_type:complete
MAQEKLKFYDLKAKKPFTSAIYTVKVRKNRRFAVTTAPSGVKSWRILGLAKSNYKKLGLKHTGKTCKQAHSKSTHAAWSKKRK